MRSYRIERTCGSRRPFDFRTRRGILFGSRETKRGMEELTSDIPNVSEEATKDLDENGIVRVGAVSSRVIF